RTHRPERTQVDEERTLAEGLGSTILTLTRHHLRRGSESGAQRDVRRAEGLLHEERQPRVENLGPVELAERAVDVCKIGQRPDQPQILRPESTLEERESLLVEQLRLLVGAAVGGVLGPP